MLQCSGVVQADTVIANAVSSASYAPGAGNMWRHPLGRRKIGGMAHDLELLRREVAVTAGVDLALASPRRHGTKSSNYVLHFRAKRRKLARCRTCGPVVARCGSDCARVLRSRRSVRGVANGHRVRGRRVWRRRNIRSRRGSPVLLR